MKTRVSSESYRCADFKETDASSFYKDFYNLQQRRRVAAEYTDGTGSEYGFHP